ncbi:MAG TPA: hypothetical protein HPP84_06745 [Rhodospirillaceae bacterium]|nr:hypothetical protein [Rhodospirillaceae bacterium]
MRRAMRAARTALLVLAVTFFMDILASQVCSRYCSFWANLDQIYDTRVRSAVYDHDLNRNISADVRWGNDRYRLVTNSLGFKDHEARRVSLGSDRYRILFIGDSFAEGIGIAYEDTFVGRVGAVLGACNVEVLNAAVVSYSPTIYYRKLKYLIETLGLRVDEVVAFLDISDIEDEANWYDLDVNDQVINLNARRKSTPFRRFRHWFRDNSMTVKLGYTIGDYVRTYWPRHAGPDAEELLLDDAAARIRRATDQWRGLWTHDPRAWQAYGARGLEKSKRRMDRLVQLLRRHQVRLTLTVYPWPAQMFENDRDSIQVVAWRDWAKKNNVGFVDLFPAFLDAGSPADVLSRFFIPFDIHWNAAGHGFVARRLLTHRAMRRPVFKPCQDQRKPATR